MNRLRLGMLTIAGFVWLGCSAAGSREDLSGTGGSTNTGGGHGTGGGFGSGGVSSGSGGIVSGSGGIVSGSGGIVSGSGGIVSGTGGVVAGTGGAAGGVECTGATTANGYMDNGTMCGYAWTASNGEGETIAPPCGNDECFMGATVCATAEVPANDAAAEVYTGVMIGWNVSQKSGSMTAGTWNATGTGITVTYTDGSASGVVRVLVKSGGSDYCAVAAASPATFAWSDFKIKCYDATPGATFALGSPVTAIILQVNGDDTAPQTLADFCLTSVDLN